MLGQLIRFGGIGGLATVVHVLIALAVRQVLQLSDQQANSAGFGAAVLVSYVGHGRYTFGVELASGPQFLRFVILSLLGLATSSATVWIATTRLGFDFIMAMAAVAILVPVMTFLALRLWVFDRARPRRSYSWVGLTLSAVVASAVLLLFWMR